jgi:hypothetical protein
VARQAFAREAAVLLCSLDAGGSLPPVTTAEAGDLQRHGRPVCGCDMYVVLARFGPGVVDDELATKDVHHVFCGGGFGFVLASVHMRRSHTRTSTMLTSQCLIPQNART